MIQPSNFLWCPVCGNDRARQPDELAPGWCERCRHVQIQLEPLDCAAWAMRDADHIHAAALRVHGVKLSARKLRLLACAFARFASPNVRNAELFARALNFSEQWADKGFPPTLTGRVRRNLRARFSSEDNGWVYAAARCLTQTCLPIDRAGSWPGALGNSYRELFPNPFLPLAWLPVWFTSTVCDLAQHIYAAHDFGAMPVLADALQDAGCDDEPVLAHCRANRPHARGCWVLDAILGKS